MKQTDLHTRLLFLSISLTWLAAPLTSLAQKTTGPQSHLNYEQAWDIVDYLTLNVFARQDSWELEKIHEQDRDDQNLTILKKEVNHRHELQHSLKEDSSVKIEERNQKDLDGG